MLRIPETIGPDDPRVPEARQFAEGLETTIGMTPRHRPVEGLDRITGSDASRTVTCVVDAYGDFLDLSIQSDWWHTVGPSGIAAAILSALEFAQNKAALAMTILNHYDREPALPARNPFPFVREDEYHGPPADRSGEIAEADARIQRGYALMEVADRIASSADSEEPRTISGPRGLFSLTLVGFDLRSAQLGHHGVTPSDADRVADDAREALLQATRETDPAYWLTREGVR